MSFCAFEGICIQTVQELMTAWVLQWCVLIKGQGKVFWNLLGDPYMCGWSCTQKRKYMSFSTSVSSQLVFSFSTHLLHQCFPFCSHCASFAWFPPFHSEHICFLSLHVLFQNVTFGIASKLPFIIFKITVTEKDSFSGIRSDKVHSTLIILNYELPEE